MKTPRGGWRMARAVGAAIVLSTLPVSPVAAQYGGYATCTDDCASCDPCTCSDGCCASCDPPWRHRTGFFGDVLYLHTTGIDMHHAQQQDGIGGAGTVPMGHVGRTDPAFELGFRVGGSVALSNCTSIVASYTNFESNARSSVVAPVIPGGGGAVGSLVHHPGAAILASPGPVDARYDVDFQLAEAEFRALMWGDSRGWVNYSLGGRYAHLEQDFLQEGQFGGGAAGLIRTQTGIEFDGGGALFGLEGERLIGCRGFSVYGNAGVAPIIGQFSTVYVMNNDTTDVLLANSVWKDDRVMTILDYELGLAWTGPDGNLRLSAGYMAQFWFNAVTTSGFIDAVQADNYTNIGDTLNFDGLVARVEVRF